MPNHAARVVPTVYSARREAALRCGKPRADLEEAIIMRLFGGGGQKQVIKRSMSSPKPPVFAPSELRRGKQGGAVAQFMLSTDVLDSSSRCKRLKVVYTEGDQ